MGKRFFEVTGAEEFHAGQQCQTQAAQGMQQVQTRAVAAFLRGERSRYDGYVERW